MNRCEYVECMGCGCPKARVIFVQQYRGLRGTCPNCDSNWPES